MSLLEIAQAMENSGFGTALRESRYGFPSLIMVHLTGLLIAVGTISLWDLRLLGISLRKLPVSRVGKALLPWTWTGFAVMALSGAAMVTMESGRLYPNTAFRVKLFLLALAFVNMLTFHLSVYRNVASWDHDAITPIRARVAGAISLAVWLGLVTAGRTIGYTINYGI